MNPTQAHQLIGTICRRYNLPYRYMPNHGWQIGLGRQSRWIFSDTAHKTISIGHLTAQDRNEILQTNLNGTNLQEFLSVLSYVLPANQMPKIIKATEFIAKIKPASVPSSYPTSGRTQSIENKALEIGNNIYDTQIGNWRTANSSEANLLTRTAKIALDLCTEPYDTTASRKDIILATLERVLMEFGPTATCNPYLTLTIPVQTAILNHNEWYKK